MTIRLPQIFGLDVRSLALFRVLLSVVLLCTLSNSLCHAGVWYSDGGIAPRAWIMEAGEATRLSLHLLEGSVVFIVAMLLLQMGCALMLLLGWRTRWASIASFVLWISLMNRNPDILLPADSMIAGLLFWSMFLPLGARYAVDAAFTAPAAQTETQFVSWASAGLLIQVISPYFFSTLAAHAESKTFMTPVFYYWFNRDGYTSTLAQALQLQFPVHSMLRMLITSTSLLSPLLIFAPVWTQSLRFVVLAGIAMMQIFVLIFLDVGMFPWACLAAITVLFGSFFWKQLKLYNERGTNGILRIYYDGEHRFSHTMCHLLREFLILPRAEIHPAQETPRTRSLMQANRSWVVLDANDQATMKWAALHTLLKHSPIFFWLSPLLGLAWVQKIGDALYDALAQHRQTLDQLCSERITLKKSAQSASRWKTYFPALMLIAYLLWSFSAVNMLPRSLRSSVDPLLKVFRLDQAWTLYSVSTLENDGWLMAPAKLADGSEADLLRAHGAVPDFNKPPHAVIAADGTRWLSYRERLWLDDPTNLRRRYLYGRYLCSQWNEAHADEKAHLATQLTLIYMLERTPPPGNTPQIEQRILGTQQCEIASAEPSR
jgi:predicted DCC family thiol-disulfide oxidoreductase YuxK